MTALGISAPVVDARDRVTGAIQLVGDIRRPNLVHGRLLRSTVPHARIVAIDASAAHRFPGVVAVVTGRDAPGAPEARRLFGQIVRDTPVLAHDRVRYAGEPIAAVAAIDPDTAEEALTAIEVELEPLPPLLSTDDALAPGAPTLHDAGNVVGERTLRLGDAAAALGRAQVVVDETFHAPAVQGVPLETHAVVAEWVDDALVVETATQTPFHVRRELAAVFDLPADRVRVVVPVLGGGFGAKAYPRIEPVAALLARFAGQPVRMVLSRAEEFVTVVRQPATVHLRTAVAGDGSLLAMAGECTFAAGAFTDNAPRILRHGLYSLPGPYRIPAVDLLVRAVHTNAPPCGPLRAPGTAQAQWAREVHLDSVARAVGMDPLELRRRNLVGSDDRFLLGGPMGHVHLPSLLDAVEHPRRTRASARKRRGRALGVGYGVAFKTTQTPSTSEAEVAVDSGGGVRVGTSTVDVGQGARTALAQIAASVLAVPLDRVAVTTPDTAVTPPDQGTVSSRSTFSMGRAIENAAGALLERLFELAERELEIARTDLVLDDGRIRPVDRSSAGCSFGELVAGAGVERLAERSAFTNEPMRDPASGEAGVSTHHHQAAASALVDVDLETGSVRIEEVRVATHAGVVVNPTLAELQSAGNVAFAVGQALMEEVVTEGGQVQNPSLSDYPIPSLLDFPASLRATLTEDAEREVHGIGETALPAVLPAITNAVADAIGRPIRRLPATPERILAAVSEARTTETGRQGG